MLHSIPLNMTCCATCYLTHRSKLHIAQHAFQEIAQHNMIHDATYCPRRRPGCATCYTGHLTHHPANCVVRRNILPIKLPNTTRCPTICPNQNAAVNHATQLASKRNMLCKILPSRLTNVGCCPASKTTNCST